MVGWEGWMGYINEKCDWMDERVGLDKWEGWMGWMRRN